MPTIYDVFKKDSTREIVIREDGAAAPAGFTAFGTYTDTDNDAEVAFHYIRDLLFAAGELNPSSWSIKRYATAALVISPAATTLDISDGETVKLGVTFTPELVNDPACTFVSSDPTKATVAADGTVTPVAAGTTNITVTNTQSGKTGVCAVTVQA